MTRADAIAQARLRKALAIATVLRDAGCDADTAASLDAAARENAERAAQVRKASDSTWELVAEVLRRMCEHGYLLPSGAKCPPFHADPFAGIPQQPN